MTEETSPGESPGIPVPTESQIVTCVVCKQHMVIAQHYYPWEGHPGYRHVHGHPLCRPTP